MKNILKNIDDGGHSCLVTFGGKISFTSKCDYFMVFEDVLYLLVDLSLYPYFSVSFSYHE